MTVLVLYSPCKIPSIQKAKESASSTSSIVAPLLFSQWKVVVTLPSMEKLVEMDKKS
jgi:hypothetical protein